MGKKERILLHFFEKKEYFADLINGWLFRGEKKVLPEGMESVDRRYLQRSEVGRELQERYKDVINRIDQLEIRVVIGTELQTYVDYLAPVRAMEYDLFSYREQVRVVQEHHKKMKDLKGDEFLSGFLKEDRLIPVLTLILYLGEKPWDAAENMHQLLEWDRIPKEFHSFIENYHIHVLDVYHTSDERLLEFPGDMGYMFLYLKNQKTKDGMKKILDTYPAFFHLSADIYDLLAEYTNEPRLLAIKEKVEREGDADMCQALRELIEDGRVEAEDRFANLINQLLADSRLEDLQRAVNDRAYRNKLYQEYSIE